MTNYTRFAVKGVSIILIVSLLSGFLGYLVRFILARNLSIEDFGLFYAVFSFLGMIGLFKSLGMDQALVKFIPEFLAKKKYKKVKGSIILTALVLFITNMIVIIVIYLLSDFLAQNYFHTKKASIVLNLMAIAFFIDSFLFALRVVYQSFKKMTFYAGIELIRMLIILFIVLAGLQLNYGILLPIAAYIITPIIVLLIFTLVFIKKVFPRFTKTKAESKKKLFKQISRYGFFVIATNIGMILLGYTDSLALTYFAGVVAVGYYNVAFPTANALSYFAKALSNMLIPMSSELWAINKKDILSKGIESIYKYSIIFILPPVLILMSFPDLIISTFFGAKYLPAVFALQILSFGMIFPCIYGPNSAFFSGIGKPQINSIIVYLTAIFNLISNIILIPRWGIIGAAVTTTTSVFIMSLIGSIIIKKYIKINFPIFNWFKIFISGIVFTGTIWLIKKALNLNVWVETTIVLLISGMIYIGLLFMLKIIDKKEVVEVYKKLIKN